jgi:hypothetical protein
MFSSDEEGDLPDVDSLRVVDLKAELKKRGLAVAGAKAVLQARLREHSGEDDRDDDAVPTPAREDSGPVVAEVIRAKQTILDRTSSVRDVIGSVKEKVTTSGNVAYTLSLLSTVLVAAWMVWGLPGISVPIRALSGALRPPAFHALTDQHSVCNAAIRGNTSALDWKQDAQTKLQAVHQDHFNELESERVTAKHAIATARSASSGRLVAARTALTGAKTALDEHMRANNPSQGVLEDVGQWFGFGKKAEEPPLSAGAYF